MRSKLIYTIISWITIAAAITACSSDEGNVSQSSFSFGKSITVKTNTNARIGTTQKGVDVLVKSISESRCPLDAICVWEGRAEVVFSIEDVAQPVSLCVGNTNGCSSTYEFAVNGTHYKLTLKDVFPFPSSSNQNEEKKAEFILEVL